MGDDTPILDATSLAFLYFQDTGGFAEPTLVLGFGAVLIVFYNVVSPGAAG